MEYGEAWPVTIHVDHIAYRHRNEATTLRHYCHYGYLDNRLWFPNTRRMRFGDGGFAGSRGMRFREMTERDTHFWEGQAAQKQAMRFWGRTSGGWNICEPHGSTMSTAWKAGSLTERKFLRMGTRWAIFLLTVWRFCFPLDLRHLSFPIIRNHRLS
jgi:hypothetical protein